MAADPLDAAFEQEYSAGGGMQEKEARLVQSLQASFEKWELGQKEAQTKKKNDYPTQNKFKRGLYTEVSWARAISVSNSTRATAPYTKRLA